jgi:HK97 family phage major capsid protein
VIQTNLKMGSFIEALYSNLVLMKAGAFVLDGLVGNEALPVSGGATGAWLTSETGTLTETVPTLSKVTLSPKIVAGYTDVSDIALYQTGGGIEELLRNDLARAIAVAIEVAALHGTGSSGQPTGIAATSGIGSVVGGTNGAKPTWANIVELESDVIQANGKPGAYITNGKVAGLLKTVLKADTSATPNVTHQFVWDGQGQMNASPAFVTTAVSSALTKGTSSGVCSAIFYGNWSELIIGFWGGLEIKINPYVNANGLETRIMAYRRCDINVRHAASFSAMLDALTA